MKRILILLTGIMLLIAVLAAGSCAAPGAVPPEDKKNVEIFCKAFEINGVLHFEMYDSKDTTKVVVNLTKDKVVARHTTDIQPKTKVTWIWVKDSEIQEFVKIGPKKYGKIIIKNAERVPDTKKLRLKIPKNAPWDSKEKYDIVFVDLVGDTVIIDPYLRIPHR